MRSDWTEAAITAGSRARHPRRCPSTDRFHAPARIADRASAGSGDPVTPIRRTIAERMVQSAQTAAGVTLSTTVDATNLVNLRQQFKAVAGAGEAPSIAFTDIVIKLTALALEKHPLLNARWSGDKIVVSPSINIGIAVDTDAGPPGPGDPRRSPADAPPACCPVARADRSCPPRHAFGRRHARGHIHGDQPGTDGHRDVYSA